MILSTFKNINLALAFFLELGVLVAWGYWGFSTQAGALAKFALGIGIPVIAIIVWALFGAPTAIWHLNGPWRLLLQIVFFGSAVVALFIAGQPIWGMVFALLFVVNTILIYVWAQ